MSETAQQSSVLLLTRQERDTLHRLNMRHIRQQWRCARADRSALQSRIVDRILKERANDR